MIPHHQYRLPKTRKDRSAKIFGDHDFNTHAHHKCQHDVSNFELRILKHSLFYDLYKDE